MEFGWHEFGGRISLPSSKTHWAIHLLGLTRTGKSNLMARLALQAHREGEGVVVIDIKDGQLARLVATHANEKVLYFTPGDVRDRDGVPHYLGLNILGQGGYRASAYVGAVLDLFTHLGSLQQDYTQVRLHLSQATRLASYLDNPTLIDVRMILNDKKYCQECLNRTTPPPETRAHFDRFLKSWNPSQVATTIPRLLDLLTEPVFNFTFGQPTTIPFEQLLNDGYMLIFNLKPGMSAWDRRWLGSVLVSILLQVAEQRRLTQESNHWRYCLDEFHQITPFGLPDLLDLLGGQRVWPILANQHRAQLEVGGFDPNRLSKALTGAPINVFFPLSAEDRKWFGETRGKKALKQLTEMEPYWAYFEARDCPWDSGFGGTGRIELLDERVDEVKLRRLWFQQTDILRFPQGDDRPDMVLRLATPESDLKEQHRRYYEDIEDEPETKPKAGQAADQNHARARSPESPRRTAIRRE